MNKDKVDLQKKKKKTKTQPPDVLRSLAPLGMLQGCEYDSTRNLSLVYLGTEEHEMSTRETGVNLCWERKTYILVKNLEHGEHHTGRIHIKILVSRLYSLLQAFQV